MGYQALLFCPDEKTARTVTQVLSELEFNVESCIEPFNAVKKLMGQHFDAVVVDCDNEQNATLLFKSARNSTPNQASLAVAVVEGQAGVAKAFRIGANLVLTKPINIEQAKGTLRVARGLLRKSDPAKPTNAPGAAVPAPAGSVVPSEASPAKTAATRAVPPAKPAGPVEPPVAKPAASPAWPASASAASSAPAVADDDVLEISADDTLATRSATTPVTPPVFNAGLPTLGSGAASAPAPAREAQGSKVAERSAATAADEEDILSDKPAEAVHGESPSPVAAAPSFTFGGANAPAESSGASKRLLLGVAAAVIVAAGVYAGWAKFQGHANQDVSSETPTTSAPVTAAPTAKPSLTQPASKKPTPSTSFPSSGSTAAPDKSSVQDDSKSAFEEDTSSPSGNAATKPAEAPLVVKGGKAPAVHAKPAAPDTSAPSVIGMATSDSGTAPPDLGSGEASAFKPVLETLNISQGVSRGLLIKKVQPVYPRNALNMHVEGAVELMATVSKTGTISHVKVMSGDSQLTAAAVEAVKQWKYKPYLLNGEPVEIQTQVTINFKLPH